MPRAARGSAATRRFRSPRTRSSGVLVLVLAIAGMSLVASVAPTLRPAGGVTSAGRARTGEIEPERAALRSSVGAIGSPVGPGAIAGSASAPPAPSTTSPAVNETGTVTTTVGVGTDPRFAAYDPADGCLYVPNFAGTSVSVLDVAEDVVVATIPLAGQPYAAAYDGQNGNIYVTNDEAVDVISGVTNALIGTIPTGGVGGGIALDTATGDLYESLHSGTVLDVIDPANDTVVRSDTVGVDPAGVAYDPTNGYVYAAVEKTGVVAVVNGANNSFVTVVPVGSSPLGIVYDGGDGDLFVADSGVASVTAIDAATNDAVATVPVGTEPEGLAYDAGNGAIYVANDGGSNVSVIAGGAAAPIGSIDVQSAPVGVAYDGSNGQLLVSDSGTGNVTVISTTLAVGALAVRLRGTYPPAVPESTVPAAGGLRFGAYDPDDDDLYFTTENTVMVVNGSNQSVVAAIPVGESPEGIVYDSDTGEIVTADELNGTLSVIRTATNQVVATIPAGRDPTALAVDAANDEIFETDESGAVVGVFYGANDTLAASISTGYDPDGIAYDSSAGELFVANGESANVSVIDAATNTVVGTVDVGTSPSGIAYVPAVDAVFVANSGSDNVSVINASTDAVVASIPVGATPNAVAYDPANGRVYVANAGTDNVTVVYPRDDSTGASILLAFAPNGLTFDSENQATYVTAPAGSLSEIFGLNGASNRSAPEADVGQEAVVAAPVIGDGAGGDEVGVVASPSVGLACAAEPAGYAVDAAVCDASAPGNYTVTLYVQDALGDLVWTSTELGVLPDPVVTSLNASRTAVDVGELTVLTAVAAGGSGDFAYAWGGLPPGCAGTDSPSVACVPNGSGGTPVTMTITLTATDSDAYSVAATLQVFIDARPALALPEITVNGTTSSRADVGEVLLISTAQTTPGAGLVSVGWEGLPSGCDGMGLSVSCEAAAPGAYAISATGTDENGVTVSSAPAALEIASDPSVAAPIASSTSGTVLALLTTVTGGIAPYHYAWFGLPAGCASTNSSELSCTPSVGGSFTVRVVVTDAVGYQVTSASSSVTVPASDGAASSSGASDLEWGALGLGGVAVALAAFAVARRRGGGRTAAPARDDPDPPTPPR